MENFTVISRPEIEQAIAIATKINDYYYEKMVGQRQLGTSLLISMIINGHILIESVPGLAKTTAAKTMTEAVNGRFSRIQCTPDLLPSDIIGTQILNYTTNTFDTKLGPVHANFVLLDEINRSSAKTQSAMLEVMQEHQTTIGGENYPVPEIFMVIATQNPIEQEGTYVLSEAQLDRFAIKEKLDYPTEDEEITILNRVEADVFSKGAAVVGLDSVKYLQGILPETLTQYMTIGSSTRGAICLMEVSKAVALLNGRDYVTPDDVKAEIHSVLRHRVTLNFAAVADGVDEDMIIDAIMGAVPAP